MLARLILHASFALIWAFFVMILWPFPYLVMNDLAWQHGYGERLVERPFAGVHHRVMATIQSHDRNQNMMYRMERSLNLNPDATVEQRQEWQANLDAARSSRNLVWLSSVAIALAVYALVATVVHRWFWSGDDRFMMQQPGASP